MRTKAELAEIIDQIASQDSPVGMDAVYVHAVILDKLQAIEQRLRLLEDAVHRQRTAKNEAGPELHS